MSDSTGVRIFGVRLNWLATACLIGVLCSLLGMVLLFGGAYHMEQTKSKSANWAVIAGFILLLPAMLGGYVLEYADVPAEMHDNIGVFVVLLVQLPAYIFLFWFVRKMWSMIGKRFI